MKNLLLSFLLIISAQLFAQTSPFKFQVSACDALPWHDVLGTIPLGKEGVIHVNNRGCESFQFFKYSPDLKLLNQNSVVFDKTSDMLKMREPQIIQLKGKSYLLVNQVDRVKDMSSISALEISTEKLAFNGELKNLYSVNGIGGNKLDDRERYNLFSNRVVMGPHIGYISCDSSKLLFTYKTKKTELRDKKNFEEVGLQVYDENLNKLWGGLYQLPYSEYDMDIESYFISNSGKVYMVARVYVTQSRTGMLKTFRYEALEFDKNTSQPKQIKIEVVNKEVYKFNFIENPKNEVYLTGIINDPYEAPFIMKFDEQNDKILPETFIDVRRPLELLKMNRTEGARNKMGRRANGEEKGEIEFYEFGLEVRKLLFTKNGSIKLIAEVNSFNSDGIGGYESSNDIYVLSFSNSHVLEWIRKIAKHQINLEVGDSSIPEYELSINSVLQDENIIIFYLDNPANLNVDKLTVLQYYKARKPGSLIGVTIDKDGEIKKYEIATTSQFESDFYLRRFKKGGMNSLVDTYRKHKKSIVYSISINN